MSLKIFEKRLKKRMFNFMNIQRRNILSFKFDDNFLKEAEEVLSNKQDDKTVKRRK